MSDPLVFISYRRSDAAIAAQALYLQLQERFGTRSLFMDVNSISWGARWPERLASRLRRATIVMPVIGENWLTAADQYGRRRLDDSNDWVRLELAEAIRQRAEVLPILLNDMKMPPPDALPSDVQALSSHRSMSLRTANEEWHRDLKAIGDRFRSFGLPEGEGPPQPLPAGLVKHRLPCLTEDELTAALQDPDLRSVSRQSTRSALNRQNRIFGKPPREYDSVHDSPPSGRIIRVRRLPIVRRQNCLVPRQPVRLESEGEVNDETHAVRTARRVGAVYR